MTTRADLEGTLARWFALDADSHLGVFTGAYAAWPSAVLEDYLAVSAADDFLASAPAVTDGLLSAATTRRFGAAPRHIRRKRAPSARGRGRLRCGRRQEGLADGRERRGPLKG